MGGCSSAESTFQYQQDHLLVPIYGTRAAYRFLVNYSDPIFTSLIFSKLHHPISKKLTNLQILDYLDPLPPKTGSNLAPRENNNNNNNNNNEYSLTPKVPYPIKAAHGMLNQEEWVILTCPPQSTQFIEGPYIFPEGSHDHPHFHRKLFPFTLDVSKGYKAEKSKKFRKGQEFGRMIRLTPTNRLYFSNLISFPRCVEPFGFVILMIDQNDISSRAEFTRFLREISQLKLDGFLLDLLNLPIFLFTYSSTSSSSSLSPPPSTASTPTAIRQFNTQNAPQQQSSLRSGGPNDGTSPNPPTVRWADENSGQPHGLNNITSKRGEEPSKSGFKYPNPDEASVIQAQLARYRAASQSNKAEDSPRIDEQQGNGVSGSQRSLDVDNITGAMQNDKSKGEYKWLIDFEAFDVGYDSKSSMASLSRNARESDDEYDEYYDDIEECDTAELFNGHDDDDDDDGDDNNNDNDNPPLTHRIESAQNAITIATASTTTGPTLIIPAFRTNLSANNAMSAPHNSSPVAGALNSDRKSPLLRSLSLSPNPTLNSLSLSIKTSTPGAKPTPHSFLRTKIDQDLDLASPIRELLSTRDGVEQYLYPKGPNAEHLRVDDNHKFNEICDILEVDPKLLKNCWSDPNLIDFHSVAYDLDQMVDILVGYGFNQDKIVAFSIPDPWRLDDTTSIPASAATGSSPKPSQSAPPTTKPPRSQSRSVKRISQHDLTNTTLPLKKQGKAAAPERQPVQSEPQLTNYTTLPLSTLIHKSLLRILAHTNPQVHTVTTTRPTVHHSALHHYPYGFHRRQITPFPYTPFLPHEYLRFKSIFDLPSLKYDAVISVIEDDSYRILPRTEDEKRSSSYRRNETEEQRRERKRKEREDKVQDIERRKDEEAQKSKLATATSKASPSPAPRFVAARPRPLPYGKARNGPRITGRPDFGGNSTKSTTPTTTTTTTSPRPKETSSSGPKSGTAVASRKVNGAGKGPRRVAPRIRGGDKSSLPDAEQFRLDSVHDTDNTSTTDTISQTDEDNSNHTNSNDNDNGAAPSTSSDLTLNQSPAQPQYALDRELFENYPVVNRDLAFSQDTELRQILKRLFPRSRLFRSSDKALPEAQRVITISNNSSLVEGGSGNNNGTASGSTAALAPLMLSPHLTNGVNLLQIDESIRPIQHIPTINQNAIYSSKLMYHRVGYKYGLYSTQFDSLMQQSHLFGINIVPKLYNPKGYGKPKTAPEVAAGQADENNANHDGPHEQSNDGDDFRSEDYLNKVIQSALELVLPNYAEYCINGPRPARHNFYDEEYESELEKSAESENTESGEGVEKKNNYIGIDGVLVGGSKEELGVDGLDGEDTDVLEEDVEDDNDDDHNANTANNNNNRTNNGDDDDNDYTNSNTNNGPYGSHRNRTKNIKRNQFLSNFVSEFPIYNVFIMYTPPVIRSFETIQYLNNLQQVATLKYQQELLQAQINANSGEGVLPEESLADSAAETGSQPDLIPLTSTASQTDLILNPHKLIIQPSAQHSPAMMPHLQIKIGQSGDQIEDGAVVLVKGAKAKRGKQPSSNRLNNDVELMSLNHNSSIVDSEVDIDLAIHPNNHNNTANLSSQGNDEYAEDDDDDDDDVIGFAPYYQNINLVTGLPKATFSYEHQLPQPSSPASSSPMALSQRLPVSPTGSVPRTLSSLAQPINRNNSAPGLTATTRNHVHHQVKSFDDMVKERFGTYCVQNFIPARNESKRDECTSPMNQINHFNSYFNFLLVFPHQLEDAVKWIERDALRRRLSTMWKKGASE